MIFLGAGAFVVGLAIHNETLAAQRPPQPEPIYYCATGEEMPLYEACKESEGYLMDTRSIYLVDNAGTPVTAFTTNDEIPT
jgi:hypothetical protein